MKKTHVFYESIFVSALFVIGTTLFYGSTGLRAAMTEPLTPGGYGKMVTAVLCIACIARLVWINLIDPVFLAPRRGQGQSSSENAQYRVKEPLLVILQVLLMLLYALGITRIGYFTSTFIYTLATMIMLTDKRNKKTIIIYTVGTLGFCFFLGWAFSVFYVLMPNTPLW